MSKDYDIQSAHQDYPTKNGHDPHLQQQQEHIMTVEETTPIEGGSGKKRLQRNNRSSSSHILSQFYRWSNAFTKVRAQNQSVQKRRHDSFIEKFTTRQDRRISIDSEEDLVTVANEENSLSDDKSHGKGRDDDDDVVITDQKDYFYDTYGDVRMRYERWIINPKSLTNLYWLALLSLAVLYNFWLIIIRTAFPEFQNETPILWGFLDYSTDLIYIADIYLSTRTGYLSHGIVVTDRHKLRQHYFRSGRVVMDVICLLPFDFFYYNVTQMFPIIRIGRLLKYYRTNDFYRLIQSRTYRPNFWRILNLIHTLFILIQWFAAIYYMISGYIGFGSDGWVYPEPVGINGNLSVKYLKSVYWATLTLTTIGEIPSPVTQIEYLFTLLSYFCGLFIFASIVGLLGNVIAKRNARRSQFDQLLDDAKEYMSKRNVSSNLQTRVQRWFDYSWERGQLNGIGEARAISMLPTKLKTELALHVHLETLKKVTLFQNCEREFLHDLVLKMKHHIYTPMDLVCQLGEIAREMYIISNGKLEVLSESGAVIATLKEGDFFGEIGVLSLSEAANRRTANVRSIGFSELFVLLKDDVLEAMEDYPKAKVYLTQYAKARLAGMKRVNSETQDTKENCETDTNTARNRVGLRKILNLSITRNKIKPINKNEDQGEIQIKRSHTISGGRSGPSTSKIRRRLQSATSRKRFSNSSNNINVDNDISLPMREDIERNETQNNSKYTSNFTGPVTSTTYANLLPYASDNTGTVENITTRLAKSAKSIENMIHDLQAEVASNHATNARGINSLYKLPTISSFYVPRTEDEKSSLTSVEVQQLKGLVRQLQDDIEEKNKTINNLTLEIHKFQGDTTNKNIEN